MVRFVVDSAEEGFMPNSCSGYRAWEIGETVDVVVINLTDKPIVSAQAAILAKEEDVYQKRSGYCQMQNLYWKGKMLHRQ